MAMRKDQRPNMSQRRKGTETPSHLSSNPHPPTYNFPFPSCSSHSLILPVTVLSSSLTTSFLAAICALTLLVLSSVIRLDLVLSIVVLVATLSIASSARSYSVLCTPVALPPCCCIASISSIMAAASLAYLHRMRMRSPYL